MKIQRMKTNRIVNPLGFDLKTPHVSWTVTDTEAKKQLWARVEVSKTENFADVIFDTGACKTASSLGVPVEIALEPRTRYFWRVTVMGDNGDLVTSDTAWFETAKLDEPFTAQRISPCLAPDTAPYMRRAFEIIGEVLSARAYFTGLGIYELYLNGEKANDEYLAPGCTAYDSWIQYQTYDVTDLIHTGENVIGAILGNGWAKGRFGFDGVVGDYETNFPGKPCNMYTEEYLLFGELHVTTTQGETVIVTDESWQCAPNPLTFGNIYDGERYDANLEIENWCAPSCTYANWQPVKRNTTTNLGAISARLSLPVKAKHIITPKQITTPKNELVFDLGQNITGWFTFMADLPAGVELRVQTGELLQDDCFYRDNLRTALSEYRYISTGKKAFIRPIATFYGFRYIKVEGIDGELNPEDFVAEAISSATPENGTFVSSDSLINRLQSNIKWGMLDNFVDIPTDCPQRDERLGWTGDAQVFFRTATFNRDVQTFFNKWMADVAAEQYADGAVNGVYPVTHRSRISAGWGDVATIIPWQHYMAYGDLRMLERQYPSMKKWVDYITSQTENDLWSKGNSYGDWVFFSYADDKDGRSAVTIRPFIQQCFYAHSLDLVVRTARLLGRTEDAAKYEALHKRAVDAFRNEYVTPNGMLVSDTQTAYTLALMFDLLPEAQRAGAAKRLVDNVNRYGHITTGFLGTPYICEVLTRFGYEDVAYELLLNKKIPSWLYPISMGATTIWERWNSMLPNGMVNSNSMVSFNHYAYGAIGDWLYRWAAGLQEAAPGFREIRIKPYLNDHFTSMKAEQRTPYGLASSGWTKEGDALTLTVEIPANTTAEVYVPSAAADKVTESGRALDGRSDLKVAGWDDGYTLVRLGSGRYEFRSTLK